MAERGGARPGAGNPGYGYFQTIRNNLEKVSPKWWAEIVLAMEGDDKEMKKFALSEINKLQAKVIPTTIQGDEGGGGITITIAKDIADKNLLDDIDTSTINRS